MTKLKYMMCTFHVHDGLLKEDLTRTGLYQWINVFQGKIKTPAMIEEGEYEKYDVIQVNLSAQDYNIPNTIREIIGKGSSTKIVCNNDYTTELWQGTFNYPDTMRRELAGADMIFGTEYYMSSTLAELAKRKIYTFPHPCHVKRLKSLRNDPSQRKPIIGVMWHRYDNFSFIPYFAVRGHGLKTHLLGYNPRQDQKPHVTELLYNFMSGGTNFPDFCKQMQEVKLIYEPFTLQSHGRTTIDTAALGIPTVGSDRIDSVRRCFPHTCVNPYDTTKTRELIQKLLSDDKFEELVVQTATENVEYYSFQNSKNRFLAALEESEKEEINK